MKERKYPAGTNRSLRLATTVGLILILAILGSSAALAQGQPATIRWVRALETGDLDISNPAGLAFSPGAKGFYVVEAVGPGQSPPLFLEVIQVSPFGDRGATARIVAAIKDPINMTFDAQANRLLIFQAASNRLIEVPEGPDGELDATMVLRHDARHFGLQNPQGMAVDPASGHLYILDAAGPRILRVEPNPEGGFDGAVVSEIDLGPADMADARGLALDPANGHFYVASPAEQELYELTATGQVVTTRDLSRFGLVGPQGLVYAPSGDLTDDPAQMSLYIADSGQVSQQTLETSLQSSSFEGASAQTVQGTSGDIVELSFTALAAPAASSFTSSLVNTVDLSRWSPPSPDPSGLAYVNAGGSDNLWMVDGEVEETVNGITHFEGANVWEMTLSGNVVSSANISSVPPIDVDITNEPTGVAWNPATGHYFFVQDDGDAVFELAPGTDGRYFTADDVVTSFDLTGQNTDGEGLAYDTWNGHLFVADGVNAEIYQYTLSGSLEGQFDVGKYGVADPESVEFNPASGTLFIMSSNSSSPVVIETTTGGGLLQTIDISDAGARTAAGMAYAPASDGSGEQRFYIVDRGIDNNSDPRIIDGKMYEVTAPGSSTEPVPPIANDDNVSTVLDTPVTINVVANDIDPNGNLDPASANNTSVPKNGTLVNNVDGTFTYTADPGFIGNDSFVYQVCDTDALCDTATANINVTEPVFEARVLASSDDAEENSSGRVGLTSSDLELVYDKEIQTVGLRFNGLPIPRGATITNAYIQFKVDEATSETVVLTIQGQAIDDAPTFVNSSGNISSRARTAASVAWSPVPWSTVGESGPDQRTSNIASVIQEIVNRGGWTSGNSLVIIISDTSGTAKRVAESFNGDQAGAPLLHVEYGEGVGNTPPEALDDNFTTSEDIPLSAGAPGVLVNDNDPDGDAVTASPVNNVSNGTLTLNSNGSFNYTPNANFHGTDSFSYRANDGQADSNEATVTITVNSVNDAPVAVDNGYTTARDTQLTVTAPGVLGNDTDVDGDALTAILADNVSNGALSLNSDGSFTYTPNSGFEGTDSFTYRANDGNGASNLATVNITVTTSNDPPVAGDDVYSTDEDTLLSVAGPGVLGNDTDADGNSFTASLVSDVNNGTLTLNANGSFNYTPDANFNGTDSFTYTANDGQADSNEATVTITVNPVNDAPVAVDDGYNATVDIPLNVGAPGVLGNDTDVEGNTLTASLVKGVSNGTLTLNSDGSFTYSPDSGFIGDDSFTYTANDVTAGSNVATVTITISPVAPTTLEVRVSASSDDAEERASGRVSLTSSDLELIFDREDQVVGLRFNGLTIPPGATILDAYVQFKVDETTADPPEPTALTIQGQADPNPLTFDNVDGNISSRPKTKPETAVSWSPAPWTTTGEAGPDQRTPGLAPIIQEIVNLPGWSNGNSLVIIISGTGKRVVESYNGDAAGAPLLHLEYLGGPPNNLPVAGNDEHSTNEDTLLSVAAPGVLGNDSDADGDTLSAILVSNVSNGTLTLNSNGSFNYTPDANFNGTDGFTYKANDSQADSNEATVTITVNSVNDAPVAVDNGYTTARDTQLTVGAPGVLGNDTDVDGDPLTAILADNVSNGALALNSDGSFTYTPNSGFEGTDSFTYTAYDGTTDSNLATVTITVTTSNDPPVAGDDVYSTDEDTLLSVLAPGVLGNDTDGDGDSLTASLVSDVSNGTLTFSGDGSLSYTPDANWSGTDSFTYKANDGVADSNDATVTITVNPVNDAPVAGDDYYSTPQDTPLTVGAPGVLGNDTDTEGATLAASLVSDVSHGSLTLNSNGSFSYTPAATWSGTDSFTYRANDGGADSNVATVTITVNPTALKTLEVRVSASSDDAEEKVSTGVMDLTSSDLELITEGSSGEQAVGMRFNDLTIPPGATIQSAYIQFQVDETANLDPSVLTIQGQNVDNAPTFTDTAGDISSRDRTTAAVSWAPSAWQVVGEAGPDQQTSDISSVIQEIVDRQPVGDQTGWVSGNSLVIIITGTGKRVAESYDGSSAPLLYVEYIP